MTGVSDGDVLTYNSNNDEWIPQTPSSGSVTDVQLEGNSIVNNHGVANITKDVAYCYSTSEKVVGKGTNGKPIYAKTWTGSTSTDYNTLENNMSYISRVYDIRCSSVDNRGTKNTLYYGGSNDYIRCWIDGGTNLILSFGSSYPVKPRSYELTLFYQKSSD